MKLYKAHRKAFCSVQLLDFKMKLTIVFVAVFLGCLSVSLGKKCAPKACTADYKPVCGSDGKTYGNKCALEAAQCKNKRLTLKNVGECCPTACNQIYKPVCGSNGKTYANECEFNAKHCNDRVTIAKRRAC